METCNIRRIGRSAVWLAALLLALPAFADDEIHRSLDASATGIVDIELFDGSIEVEGWERKEVQLTARLARAADEVVIDRHGQRIAIEVESPTPGASRAHMTVRVPRGSSIRIEVMSASVEVTGVEGKIDIEAVAGGIRVAGRPKSVRANTVTGSIHLETADSEALVLETVSGTLEADGETRSADMTSVAGPMRLRLRGVSNGRFETVSGSIDAELAPAPRGRLDFESFSGSMVVSVPPTLSARFRLESTSGRVASKLAGARENRDEGRLEVEQGDGDASFSLESFSGRIEIRPLPKR